jgi:hypothetical protein
MVNQICKKGLLGLIILIIVLSSCTKDGIKTVDSSTFQPAVPKPLDVGSVTFDVDPTHNASLDYAVDNYKDQVLQMTDASGLTWTLTLPLSTLDYDQTITMTALSNITSKDIPGKIIGGVQLGPDGTTLSAPATITVNGAGEEAVLLFFTGKQDGSNAELALPARDRAQNSATIFHFSSFWSDDIAAAKSAEDPNWGNYMKGLGNQLDGIIAKAEAQLQKPITYPVPPPSIDISGCKDDQRKEDDNAIIEKYLEQFMEPEIGFVGELMSLGKAQEQATGHWGVDPYTGEPGFTGTARDPRIFPLIEKLIKRTVTKFAKLIDEYGKKPQYLIVMLRMYLRLKYKLQIIGADETFIDNLHLKLTDSIIKAMDKLIKMITDQHDYSAALDIVSIKRTADMLGYSTVELEDVFARIQKAMTFKMKGNYEWHTMDTQWELKTDFPVSWDGQEGGRLTGSGPGTIDFTYTGPKGKFTRDPGGFTWQASIKMDVCNSKAFVVTVSPFAAESDTIHEKDLIVTNDISMTAWKAGFSDHEYVSKTGDPLGAWGFEDTFWNLNPNPFNGVFDAKSPTNKFAGVFTITLEHTPQK